MSGPRREHVQLLARVNNTILETRAPSMRWLYALNWSVFHDWCSAWSLCLGFCDVSQVLTFLQELLDNGHAPSTLKIYVAAFAANYSLKAGQSIGRNNLVVKFFRSTQRWNPSCAHIMPTRALPLSRSIRPNCGLIGFSVGEVSGWLAGTVSQCFLSWVWA